MTGLHVALGAALIAVNLAAGAWGAWRWWRVEPSAAFWPMLRTGQALVMVQAVQGAILLAMGEELPELHLVYGLVPLGVSFLAEQLRLVAADAVLQQRGLEGRAAVEALPEAEQHSLVHAIVRREMGVMAASALVVAALGVRAAGL
ncbi:MAG: hypothetical protein ACRDPC_09285 [Solirubrobacteraceae bacterium]